MVTDRYDMSTDQAAGAVAVHLGTLDVDGPRDGYYGIVGLWLVTDGVACLPPSGRLQMLHWMLPGVAYTLTPGPDRLIVAGGTLESPGSVYWLETAERRRPSALPDRWHDVPVDAATSYLVKPDPVDADWTICQLIGSLP